MKNGKSKNTDNGYDDAPFTKEQLKIIEERRAELLSGKVKGITDWKGMLDNIRKERKVGK